MKKVNLTQANGRAINNRPNDITNLSKNGKILSLKERGTFIKESELGPDLSRDSLSPETWDEIGHNLKIDDKDLPF